jgi:hypothetical protein
MSEGLFYFLCYRSVRAFDLDQRCVKRRWAGRCRNISETAQQRFKRRYTMRPSGVAGGLFFLRPEFQPKKEKQPTRRPVAVYRPRACFPERRKQLRTRTSCRPVPTDGR